MEPTAQSCHGDPWSGSAVDSSLPGLKRVTGARSCSITGAIFGTSVFPQGVPDMVAFGNRQLTTTQIDAISVYLNSRTVTGEQRYVATCAGCHGNDGRGGRVGKSARGENANGLAEAIRETRSMQFLGCLPSSDIQSMATFLGSSNSAGGGSDETAAVVVVAAAPVARRCSDCSPSASTVRGGPDRSARPSRRALACTGRSAAIARGFACRSAFVPG